MDSYSTVHIRFNCLTSDTPNNDLHFCSASCLRLDEQRNSTLVNLLDSNRIYASHLIGFIQYIFG